MATASGYHLGLDVGIGSIGWGLINPDRLRIIDHGVRAFEPAEDSRSGEPLNLARRTAKSTRKRLRRRANRLHRARQLFLQHGLLSAADLDPQGNITASGEDPWALRAEALDARITPRQLGIVLYHILKHRGYRTVERGDDSKDDKETGKMLAGIKHNQTLLEQGDWRTIGEMYARSAEFSERKRNRSGDYSHTILRQLLHDEINALFAAQRKYGATLAQPLQAVTLSLLMEQRPALSGEALLDMVGYCTLEPGERRTPRRCYSAERFIWLGKLNNLTLIEDGIRRSLTNAERNALIDLPWRKTKVSYKQLRDTLTGIDGGPGDFKFVGLRYGRTDNPEKTTVVELKGFHDLRRAFLRAGLSTEWKSLATRPALLDQIGYVLTVYKTDAEVGEQLRNLDLDQPIIDALADVAFSGFVHLSRKALDALLPYMQQGQRFDQACESADYSHHNPQRPSRQRYLPPLASDTVRNPVVYRALNQARKVINAIIKRHGPPIAVHIELARDLSKSRKDRDEITTAQETFRDQRDQDRRDFIETFNTQPRGGQQRDLFKYRLYRQQDCKCLYSLKPIDLTRLLEPNYVEIDHILPFSRSFDNSQNNQVLVLAAENRNKANKTPYEYFGHDEQRWHRYEQWIRASQGIRWAKKQRLLRRDFTDAAEQGFRESHLYNTRYLARLLKNHIEHHLYGRDDQPLKPLVVSGALTGFLRARWGLLKDREANNRHHALDAIIVALCSPALVKRLSDWSRRRELETLSRHSPEIDPVTGEVINSALIEKLQKDFPIPWPHFRNELLARLAPDPIAAIRADPLLAEYELDGVRPMLVSWPVHRRASGAAHEQTINSAKCLEEGRTVIKRPLQKLTQKSLEKMVAKHRDTALYQALWERLNHFGGDGKKAFREPFYKPCASGRGPIVRAIKIYQPQKAGVMVRGGIAKNTSGSMARVDVFRHQDQFLLVPVYIADLATGRLPDRAIVAHKPENQWPRMGQEHEFLFALYPGELVSVVSAKEETTTGYFRGCDRDNAKITLLRHDRDQQIGKDGFQRSSTKTAKRIEKYHVDPLGYCYRIPPGGERELA